MNYYKHNDQRYQNVRQSSDFASDSVAASENSETSNSDDIEDVKIKGIRNELEIVKISMLNNIDQVVERRENLEVLIDKSDSLHQNSYRFNNQTRVLRRRLCRQNFLRGILVLIVILLVLYIIIGSTCGFNFACLKKH